MKKYSFLFLMLALIAFSSCDKEEQLLADGIIEEYVPDVNYHPFVKEAYENYNTGILLAYDLEDYRWSISGNVDHSQDTLSFIQTDDLKTTAIDWLKVNFFDEFADEIKLNYFPPRILLVDTVYIDSDKSNHYPSIYLKPEVFVISNMGEAFADLDQTVHKVDIIANFMASYLLENAYLKFPREFYDISSEYYQFTYPANEFISMGFLPIDNDWESTSTSGKRAPGITEDVMQYIKYVMLSDAETANAQALAYSLTKKKYMFIVNELKEKGFAGFIANEEVK